MHARGMGGMVMGLGYDWVWARQKYGDETYQRPDLQHWAIQEYS